MNQFLNALIYVRVDDSDSRPSYVTKYPYYTSKPILKEMYIQVFNKYFLEFYDHLKNCKGTLLELLKVRVTEHDVVSFHTNTVSFATQPIAINITRYTITFVR